MALVALRFSWDFSGFHHCPWPSTFPALLSTRPNTVCGRREIKGVTSHTLGLQKEGEGVGVVCVNVGRRRKIAMKLHTCSFYMYHKDTHTIKHTNTPVSTIPTLYTALNCLPKPLVPTGILKHTNHLKWQWVAAILITSTSHIALYYKTFSLQCQCSSL